MRSLLTRAGSVALVVAATLSLSPPADAAPSWTPATVLGPTGLEAGVPEVAVAPNGEAVAAWASSGAKGIQVSSRRPGKGWSPPVTIAPATGEIEGPELAVSARKAVIVWTDNVRTRSGPAQVVMAATRLRGERWSAPRRLSAEKRWYYEPEGEGPQVAMTRGGKAIAVWSARDEGHSTTSFIASSTQAAAGTDWTASVGIRGSYFGYEPQVATGPAGEAMVLWGAFYNEESHVGSAIRRKGRWQGAGQFAAPPPVPQLQLAITAKGEAVGAWVDESEEGTTVVRVATRPSGGKWKLKTLAPQDAGTAPEIVTGPGGRATVIWVKGPTFQGQAVVASTHDPGGGWSKPIGFAAKGLPLPVMSESSLAVTPRGESLAVWVSAGPTGEATIQSSSRRPRQPWGKPTKVFAFPAGPLRGAPDLQLALAPAGQAFAVWRSYDGTRWVTKAATRPARGGRARLPR